MSEAVIPIPGNLTPHEAATALDQEAFPQVAKNIKRNHGIDISYDKSWDGWICRFSVTAQGYEITGAFGVRTTQVVLESLVVPGMVAMFAVSKKEIREGIVSEVRECLAQASRNKR